MYRARNMATESWPPEELQKRLDQLRLSLWGLVILRVTYSSQEKWDRYLANFKAYVHDACLQSQSDDAQRGSQLWANHEWTIFEDEATMDGISFLQAAEIFEQWRTSGADKQEILDFRAELSNDYCDMSPVWANSRWNFFIFVDEQMLDTY